MQKTPNAVVTLTKLSRGDATPFALDVSAEQAAAIAERLGLIRLRKIRFDGTLTPKGRHDWVLQAHLGATVVQPCVITQTPVTTRIEEPVVRRYLADLDTPASEEAEMPEDDSAEPLPRLLDLGQVLEEAVALAMPQYPKADGAELGAAQFAGPGVAPLTDEDTKPLAGLAALRSRLQTPEDGGGEG